MRLFALLAFVFAAIVAACGPPPAVPDGPRAIPIEPIVDVSCVLLRLTRGAHVDEICATAEELAPLVPDLLATREALHEDAGPISGPTIAFSMADPCERTKRPPRVRRARDAGASLIVHPVESSADAGADAPRDSPSE